MSVAIFGSDVVTLRGKTTRQQPFYVAALLMSPVPPAILEAHKNICLRVDVCYVNNLLILTTIFRVIKFRTVSILANTTNLTTLRALLDVISVYLSRDFVVSTIHADNSFNGLHQQTSSNTTECLFCRRTCSRSRTIHSYAQGVLRIHCPQLALQTLP